MLEVEYVVFFYFVFVSVKFYNVVCFFIWVEWSFDIQNERKEKNICLGVLYVIS